MTGEYNHRKHTRLHGNRGMSDHRNECRCAMTQPDVSSIVVVRPADTPGEVQRSLDSIVAQAGPGLSHEIIVVDTRAVAGDHSAAIRVAHRPGAALGAARQAALEMARAPLVAWCDAGDVWSATHLSALVACLREDDDAAVVYADTEARAFDYHHLSNRDYVYASASMARRAALLAVGGFDLTAHEDEMWDIWVRVAELHPIRQLPQNLTELRARPTQSRRIPTVILEQAQFRERMTHARSMHLAERHKRIVPFNPDTWREDQRELIMQAPFTDSVSFGVVTRELALGLEALGVTITVGPLRSEPPAGWERFYEREAPRAVRQDRLAFYFDFRVGPCALRAERIVRYTMWESTQIPHEQITESNATCALIYVPCRQNIRAYLECGLRAPLKLLPHGVNPERFPLLERVRTGDEPFTFGAIGAFSPRKGIDVLMRAFHDEFAPREHVRLLLKATYADHGLEPPDPRIQVLVGFLPDEELRNVLRACDAFVLPSRGEGFGLPGLEAMSTGLPLIATNWSGPADYLDPADSYPLDYELRNPGGAGSYDNAILGLVGGAKLRAHARAAA